MEYEFKNDPITGSAKAKFSLEHELIGPWIEVEVGASCDKLTQLLTALDEVESGKTAEVMITGHEYSVVISTGDVAIQTNASMNGADTLPEELLEELIDFDPNDKSECGTDDFRKVLLAWAKFTNN